MATQRYIEGAARGYAGERKYGAAANVPANRPHKPTDAEMGGVVGSLGGSGGDKNYLRLKLME